MQLCVLSLLCVVAVCAAFNDAKLAPLLAADSPTAVEGEYIVVFKEELTDEDVASHKTVIRNLMGFHNSSKILNEYSIGKGFRGYSAKMTDKLRDTVLAMNHVKYMERNQEMHILQTDCLVQTGATWGIVRASQRDRVTNDFNYDYSRDQQGEGVDAYIIDTGIYADHSDFGGRASAPSAADFIDGTGRDGNGHGTHCAGTVMSNTWGVAKKATAIGVRVLNNSGSGSTAGVIAGVNYVASNGKGKKSVANMSLGGGRSTSMNNAVNAAVDAGVHFSVAAGNEGQDSCNVSPASAEKVVTVAASDSSDQIASFSNYGGGCTNIIAPGVSVTSTWNFQGGTNTISGTSMSAPHVAGVIAKYLSQPGTSYTPDSMKTKLSTTGSKNKISGLTGSKSTTPNELVFNECA